MLQKCYHIIGFPEGHPSGRGRGKTQVGRGRGGQIRANAIQTPGQTIGDADKARLEYLSAEDWSRLKSILNSHKSSSSTHLSSKTKTSWFFDTGASHHMIGVGADFNILQDIFPRPVKLPNGDYVMATGEEKVLLGSLVLKNLLYVPVLEGSLISITKLIRDKNYMLKCIDCLCIVQDRILNTLIGVGEVRDRLYVLKENVTAHVNKVVGPVNVELWHKRMGHPCKKVLESLSPSIGSIQYNSNTLEHCDVCFRAKQTRQHFVPSENKENANFDLIHCDLRGTYCAKSICGFKYFFDNCRRSFPCHLGLFAKT